MASAYGKLEYWEDRYQKDKEQFDWYNRFTGPPGMGIKHIVEPFLSINDRILNVGAGNSRKYHTEHKILKKMKL